MNNTSYNSVEFSNNSAFVMQDDILMETLTVRGKYLNPDCSYLNPFAIK